MNARVTLKNVLNFVHIKGIQSIPYISKNNTYGLMQPGDMIGSWIVVSK